MFLRKQIDIDVIFKGCTILKILFIFIALTFFIMSAVAAPQLTSAPQNPEFLIFNPEITSIEEFDFTAGERAAPFVVIPINQEDPSIGIESLPSDYLTASVGKITPVKDQMTCGSCWAFATMGSLEGTIATSSFKPDYSEDDLKNNHGFDWGPCEGGNAYISMATLGRWSGPILESSDPYRPYVETVGTGTSVRHVQKVHFIPTKISGSETIKQAIINFGPMYTTLYYNGSYYNSGENAYWYEGDTGCNHAVTIVGWDDTYNLKKFNKINDSYPPANGAWIAKNSWGESWGENGYFWISYYDSHFAKRQNAVFLSIPKANFKKIFSYDTLGWVNSLGYGEEIAWFANIFKSDADQRLKAFSTYTPVYNTRYVAYFYKNVARDEPRSGKLIGKQSGIIHYPGFHTIKLNVPKIVKKDQKFSVVIKLKTPGWNWPVPIEEKVPGYSSAASARAHRGYITSDGRRWDDITIAWDSNTDICLKAYAK